MMFHGKRVAAERLICVLAGWAEGLGIRATARVLAVDPTTVLGWLGDAAEQLQAFPRDVRCAGHVNPLQLAELYAMLREVKDGDCSDDDAIKRLERSPYGVGTASGSRQWDAGSTRGARVKRACSLHSWCARPITPVGCPTGGGASRGGFPSPRTAGARARCGGPVHRPCGRA
jgi:hypothetical protein